MAWRHRLEALGRTRGQKGPEEKIGEKPRSTATNADAQNPMLTVSNPPPYYMSPGNIRLGETGLRAEMIPPFSSVAIPAAGAGSSRTLSWTVIDD